MTAVICAWGHCGFPGRAYEPRTLTIGWLEGPRCGPAGAGAWLGGHPGGRLALYWQVIGRRGDVGCGKVRPCDNGQVALNFAGAVLDLGVNDLVRAEAYYSTLIGREPDLRLAAARWPSVLLTWLSNGPCS